MERKSSYVDVLWGNKSGAPCRTAVLQDVVKYTGLPMHALLNPLALTLQNSCMKDE